MKRGKEDEKVMSPMFPRLHVNEREKGGPRAPPRNKMALYEQLSIPSQRFNSGLNSNLNTSSAASSTQIIGNKRPMFSPLHLPRSTPSATNSNATSSDFNASSAAHQRRLNEEDFAVPIFVQPENGQNNKTSDNVELETVNRSKPARISGSSRNQSTCTKEQKQNSTSVSNSNDELQSSNDALNHEVIDGPQLQSVQKASSKGEYNKEKTKYSLGIQNEDRCDDDSDTSMVDSVSGVYITPDEVVGVIGQKHFWKARRAIVNQQRVFAVQVFELHRLIKVQKLFAGSPNLLNENTNFVGNTLKTPIPKQISLEFIVEPPPKIDNPKENHLDNPTQNTEASTENVEKSSISSPQSVSHHHNPSFPSNHQSTPVTYDPSTNPWHFNQPTGQHWLVPIMSPTEGLIYKPYAGPDHTGSNPTMSNFSNPHPYGIPNPQNPFFQGFGMAHPGYFPQYSMPYMGPKFYEQQQNSCNEPTQMNDSIPNIQNFVHAQMGKESDLQASTDSNLFPTRAIKVVPRNAVSANESAFRIFQSIQKERERDESA